MPTSDDFLRQLRATFVIEAREHVQTLARGLNELNEGQEAQARSATIETIFRAAHSLKGAARAVELPDIESICQSLEDVFAVWRRERHGPLPETFDVLHRAVDTMEALVAGLSGLPNTVTTSDVALLRKELRRLGTSGATGPTPPTTGLSAQPGGFFAPATAPAPAPVSASAPLHPERGDSSVDGAAAGAKLHGVAPVGQAGSVEGTVRVTLPRLEAQLLEAEELLVAKLAAIQRVADLRELDTWFKQWRTSWRKIESDMRVLRKSAPADLARVLDFCDWSDTAVRGLEGRVAQMIRTARHDRDVIGKSVDNLLENAKKLLLLPFASISASFPKLVRDLCREQGKEAELRITGEHVELDKRILEEMKDPLVHMLRNAVDHAVELPAERTARGKPRRASIVLTVSHAEGNRVQIVLSDDGAGIVPEQVRAAAVRRGLVAESDAASLDDAAAQALVFRSEVSTGAMVTHVSGRGLGLAIVYEHTRRLGGDVRLQSEPGVGTTFSIVVPASRATFRGILCESAGRLFLIPVSLVERVARVRADAVRTVEARETVTLNGRAVALVRLADVLELDSPVADGSADVQLLLVGTGDQAVAFAVDAILEEQEVLVKPLRKPLIRVRNVAAAAVLGTGKVVPILNVADLLKSARHITPKAMRGASDPAPLRPAARSILVAEDSITSRILLKTILESAGYKVRTAVDGMEAFSLLRTEVFDLLVSDVEMPRLNGFDLTARVRADKKLADLPVVLVTALATPEHQERGIDVGANAYIVKGSFSQDSLLEAVERLL